MKDNWLLILIVIAGLFIFGWIVKNGKNNSTTYHRKDLIAVAAVRGGNEMPQAGGDANVVVDYVHGLQDDVNRARENVDKYNKAGQTSVDGARQPVGSEN